MDDNLRRIVCFDCEGDRLFGTIDDATGTTGLLIVSGGNELRIGAHRGMAALAQTAAAAGVPTFRFDRRGVGDSEGTNGGYATSAPDIAAAVAAFQHEQPHLTRIVGFGNCDAATALMLFGDGFGALVLANPWLGDEDAPPPPAAVRAHFIQRLVSPGGWRKLFDISRLADRLRLAFAGPREQPLAARVAARLGQVPTTIVLAKGDRTAQVFAAAVRPPAGVRVVEIATGSHSFTGEGDALATVLLESAKTYPPSGRMTSSRPDKPLPFRGGASQANR